MLMGAYEWVNADVTRRILKKIKSGNLKKFRMAVNKRSSLTCIAESVRSFNLG